MGRTQTTYNLGFDGIICGVGQFLRLPEVSLLDAKSWAFSGKLHIVNFLIRAQFE